MIQIKSVWHLFIIVCFSVCFSFNTTASTLPKHSDMVIAGWLEYVVLEPWDIKLRAKLDTGAKTSSLHALNIERFIRDGQSWVRFNTEDKKITLRQKQLNYRLSGKSK